VKCQDWRKVPPGALLAVQWKQDKGWHWVVADQDADGLFLLDPRQSVKAVRRRDFGRMPLNWYHSVRFI
jgi:hypothetical protein